MAIKIDYTRDALISDYAKKILKERYFAEGEKSPQEAFARAAAAFADDEEHAQRLYDYVSQQWFMFSTPILANGGTKRGLPISCYLQYVPDSRAGIFSHWDESGWLASMGGGLGASWSALRTNKTKTSSGGESTGMIPFLAVMDRIVQACKQAGTRRAAYATYLDVSHPEIVEFIHLRKATGGAQERKCLNLHNAVNIPDSFMEKLTAEDDSWPLIDPHSQKVVEVISARYLWQQILSLRVETGEPYLHFIDTSNRHLPEAQKALGLRINTSNLCSEITLATNEERTAVCCLSSVNLEKWDDWKGTPMVQDLIRMLDNVIEAFITADFLKPDTAHSIRKAQYSAMRERSLGLGAMGFHAYLQSKGVPFESDEAAEINRAMFKHIRAEAEKATFRLGDERGACPDADNEALYGSKTDGLVVRRRNMHLIAIAPNASSGIICGNTSPGVEPYSATSFSQKTESGVHVFKNHIFLRLMHEKGMTEDEIASTWRSIAAKKGSVQHLDFLSEREKQVFKTAFEIDQGWIIRHAAERQKYIDQAQSVNVFFNNPVDVAYLHRTHYDAWKQGLKTLYYLRNKVESSVEDIGKKVERKKIGEKPLTTPDDSASLKKTKRVTTTGFEISCIGCD